MGHSLTDKMKQSKVIPHVKKGCPSMASYYRPIYLRFIFSKITEKVIYTCMYTVMEMHETLYSLQFGFCGTYSINHALVSLTEATNLRNNRKYSCGIFIDLQKAFVNHTVPVLKV